jgi:hypothetical protein
MSTKSEESEELGRKEPEECPAFNSVKTEISSLGLVHEKKLAQS